MNGLDLLVEVGTEEIPAGYLNPALDVLRERTAEALSKAGLEYGHIRTLGTPRRLALLVKGLAEHQPDQVKEVTGPPANAAYDANGNPTKAAEGFAAGQGVNVTDLKVIDTKKGQYIVARKEIKGRPAGEVLVEALPPLILGLPWPKSMRWGQGEVTFVRPVHWLLAVLDGKVLPMAIGDIQAGKVSYGHRFMHPEAIEILSPDEYESRLAQAFVTADFRKRTVMVREEINRVVSEGEPGLTVLPDDDLVDEIANLVEMPNACLGRFDDYFLELPDDVMVTAMREHQRYFALAGEDGRLRPYFIAINNTRPRDMKVVTVGHERVLRARLEDARFYFFEDKKTTLESKQDELKRVVFHVLMGTSRQKVERFSKLGEHLADLLADQIGDPEVKPVLARAAALCKCDLVSGVVGEFPTLQGIMGREYALIDGEKEAVAQAIYEHYLPNRAGGELPGSAAGALLSMADKMDTIAGCFGVGLLPTGTADPYALRRNALGIINIILDRGFRLSLGGVIDQALAGLSEWLKRPAEEARADILEFFRLRLKNQLTGQGASTDGAEAVLSLHHNDLVAANARVWALEEIKSRPDFLDLATAFKRVVNIIRKFGAQEGLDPNALAQEQEKALFAAAAEVEKKAEALIAADDYAGFLTEVVALKPTVDSFFDHVLVDDPDPKVKANRLALLTRVSRLFDQVADFTKITT